MLTKQDLLKYQALIKNNPHIIQTCENEPVNIRFNKKKILESNFKKASRELLQNFN